MSKRLPYMILTYMIAFIYLQWQYLTPVHQVDYYALFLEGLIVITLLVILFNIAKVKVHKNAYNILSTGFFLLFAAFLTDMFDELYHHPIWVTAIFEDLAQAVGFMLLCYGIAVWIKLNKQQQSTLAKLSITDELTGLYSRRHFNHIASLSFATSQRNQSTFSILLIDIDNFKNINDNMGHAAGDVVLKRFANKLRDSVRKTDTVARWDGEEFIILLADTDPESSLLVAENIRENGQLLCVEYAKDIINFTVSIGVATLKTNDIHMPDMIKRADQFLYEAKQTGKNKVLSGPSE